MDGLLRNCGLLHTSWVGTSGLGARNLPASPVVMQTAPRCGDTGRLYASQKVLYSLVQPSDIHRGRTTGGPGPHLTHLEVWDKVCARGRGERCALINTKLYIPILIPKHMYVL